MRISDHPVRCDLCGKFSNRTVTEVPQYKPGAVLRRSHVCDVCVAEAHALFTLEASGQDTEPLKS